MKKFILAIAFFSTLGVAAYAQQKTDATVVFDTMVYDFGNIEKTAGQQSFTFEFTNKGKEPVIVQNVATTCGCATSGWTKEPVLPGARGYVKATYTPSAPMAFDKSLMVSVAGVATPITLRIKGTVVNSPVEGK